MINVNVKKRDEKIKQVVVKGHANYDEAGKDIVCSAVSALTIGAINSVEILLNVDLRPEHNDKKGGLLAWEIPDLVDKNKDDQLQLLMKALVESLLMVEKDYKRYLKVKLDAS